MFFHADEYQFPRCVVTTNHKAFVKICFLVLWGLVKDSALCNLVALMPCEKIADRSLGIIEYTQSFMHSILLLFEAQKQLNPYFFQRELIMLSQQ